MRTARAPFAAPGAGALPIAKWIRCLPYFGVDLYQRLRDRPGNLFFSPYSISTALAMTCAGARGDTETQIAKTAHFDPPPEKLHASFASLGNRMNQVQRHWDRLKLKTANSLWVQKGHRFSASFLDLIRSDYHAEAESIDFVNRPADAANRINEWIRGATENRIQSVVVPGSFDSGSDLVLCNAIYFKGRWAEQFAPSRTKPAPFYVSDDKTVSIPMMSQKADFKRTYIPDAGVTLLDLPYYGGDISMVVLLPYARDGLADLESKLSGENLTAWLAALDKEDERETVVWLPRFTTKQTLDLPEVLRSMGMASAFSDAADFRGLDGTKNLYLSDFLHSAAIEVNETGTVAVAVTFAQVKTKGMTARFIADHPFLFLIRDKGSGTIFFLGRVVDRSK